MEKGRFGIHGGQYIPETLMNEIIHLEEQYEFYKNDPEFCAELDDLLKNYAGRPSLLYYAEKMTKDLGGAKIYLKREDCKPSEVISETIQRKLQRTEGFSDAKKEQKRRQQLLHPFLGKGFQPCVEKWGQQAQHHISAHEPVMSGLHRKNTVPDVVGIENLRPRKDTDKCQNRRNQHRIKQRLNQHLRHTPEGKGTEGKKISADQHINVDCDNAD